MKLRIRLIAFMILAFIAISGIQNANAQPVLKDGKQTKDVQELLSDDQISAIGNYGSYPSEFGYLFPEDQRLAIEDHSVNIIRGYENNQLNVVKQNLISLIRDYELAEMKFQKMGWGGMSFFWAIDFLNYLLSILE